PSAQSPASIGASTTRLARTKMAKTTSGTTESGIPIVTTLVPVLAPKRSKDKPNVEGRGYSLHVAVDESKPAPATMSSVLAMDAAVKYTPSNADAVVWAEKYQPQLFADLTNLLQPYLDFSANER